MAVLATVAWIVYLGLAFGYRTYAQLRATGQTGFVGFNARSRVEALSGASFALALALGFGGALAGVFFADAAFARPMLPASRWLVLTAAIIYAFGLLATLYAQFAMGSSWRIGVDRRERTSLVTEGAFRFVRNPIFSAMLLAGSGLVLLYPAPLACVAYALLWLGLELQVRRVEEPYLLNVHGERYLDYAARTGRFVPRLGRLSPERATARAQTI